MSQQEVLCPACRGGNSAQAIYCQWCGLGLREVTQKQDAPNPVYRTPAPQQAAVRSDRPGCTTALGGLLLFGVLILGALWLTGVTNPAATPITRNPTATRQAVAQNQPTRLPDNTPAPAPTQVPVDTPIPLPTEPPPPTETPVPPPPIEQPVVLKGATGQNTAPFNLEGGTYEARWSGTLNSSSCFFNVVLRSITDEDNYETIASAVIKEGAPSADATFLYNIAPGQYYLDVTESGCSWEVTLTPK